jgi:Tfp pilus assembly protein PilN
VIRVNLLPEDRRPVERTPLPRLAVFVFGSLLVMIEVMVVIFYVAVAIPDRKRNLDNLEKNIPSWKAKALQVDEMEKEADKLQKRMDAVLELYKKRRTWARTFERLRECVPDAVWLRKLQLKGDADGGVAMEIEASVSGQSTRKMYDDISAFMKKLEGDETLKEMLIEKEPVSVSKMRLVSVGASREDPKRPTQATEFSITVRFKSLEPKKPPPQKAPAKAPVKKK